MSLDKKTFSVDIIKTADYGGGFITTEFDQKFDAIWCDHSVKKFINFSYAGAKFIINTDTTSLLIKEGSCYIFQNYAFAS